MSLLGVLIAATLGAMVVFSTFTAVNQVGRMSRQIASQGVLKENVLRMEILIQEPAVCSEYFAGKQFDPTPTTLESQVIRNILIHQPGDPSKIIAQEGMRVGTSAFTFGAIEVGNFVLLSSGKYLADLIVHGTLGPAGLGVSRRIPIRFNTSNLSATKENIDGCQASPDTGGATGASNLLGGTLEVILLKAANHSQHETKSTATCGGATRYKSLDDYSFCLLSSHQSSNGYSACTTSFQEANNRILLAFGSCAYPTSCAWFCFKKE